MDGKGRRTGGYKRVRSSAASDVYKRQEGGETEESLHRTSTMVVWESLNEWKSWRSRLDSMSDSESKAQQKEYDAFVAKYNENTKVVAQNRWCML